MPALALPEDTSETHTLLKEQTSKKSTRALEDAINKKAALIKDAPAGNPVLENQSENEASLNVLTGKEDAGKTHGEIAKKSGLVKGADISDANIALSSVQPEDLPRCPQCKTGLLRPGVVWFGESLPEDVIDSIDEWMDSGEKIDLMLVIGTSSKVYPAAGYTHLARQRGARVAVINMDPDDAYFLEESDWFFHGDAAEIVPEILKSVVGNIPPFEQDAIVDANL